MKRMVISLLALLLIGCASGKNYVPDFAFKNPARGISIPHPVEYEREGVKKITIFYSIMDPGLHTEMIGMGGVWPVTAGVDKRKYDGYVYVIGVNYWGDYLLRTETAASLEELKDARFLSFNRDAGFAYIPMGIEVGITDEKDQSCIAYDPEKMDKNLEYRSEFFKKYGKTVAEIEKFMKQYYGVESESDSNLLFFKDVAVGSPEWQNYKEEVEKIMPVNYKMDDGSIRCGYLPVDIFRAIAVENNGLTSGQRFLKLARVPLIALPFTGAGFAITAAAGLASDAIVAGIKEDWTGFYARAKTMRYQLAPQFRQICAIYKQMLAERDERIKKLQNELNMQKGG